MHRLIRAVRLPLAALVPALASLAIAHAQSATGASSDRSVIHDTLRLYYVGYAIGRERYSVTSDAHGHHLATDFDYKDRGRRTHLTAEMQLTRDFAPMQLEISRLTDSSTRVETRVNVRGRRATVMARGHTTQVTLPSIAFAIASHTPTVQHLMLLRYWMAHGRPSVVNVVPGGPTNVVRINWRGRDTLSLDTAAVGTRPKVLDRYSVDGVVWGRESVWLDDAGRLAAFTTAGGGGLTLEAVRESLAPLLPRFMAIATQDRLADLARLSRAVHPVASGTLALVGGTLIDGTERAPVRDATVLIAGGRIVAAGPAAEVAIPRSAQRVDVHGRTIAPGLWDMHAHVMQIEWPLVYLAAGVTTVRDMGNEIAFIVPLRAAIDSGRVLGPHLLLAGLVDGGGPAAFGAVQATTPEEGREVVRRYHELGFEQMKLYTLLTPGVVGAIAREAHRLGMTVTGHVPASLTLLSAVDSGMDHIAHLPIRGDPRSDSVRSLIDSLKAHGTVIDPTASWGELLGHSLGEPVASFQPDVLRLPPVLKQRIVAMGAPAIDTATAHARLARTLDVLRALHAAGVPVVAGTDEGVPGFSVYREIELYAKAGFTPLEALQAATSVPAMAMRLRQEVGTIEPGRRADLIVLDANPLDQPQNIRSVRMVMTAGTLYRTADIWRVLGFARR